MRYAIIGWQEGGRKDFARVDTSEVARLRDWEENLSEGIFMNRKVVD